MEANQKDLIVRRVVAVDLRATAELIVKSLAERPGAPSAEAVRNAVQAALEDEQRVLCIGAYHENQPGFAHGKMVGVLMMNVLVSVEQAGQVGWIETLFVRPDYRRRGLGARMLGQTLDWARARGLRSLDIEIHPHHEEAAAGALYEKHRFRELTLGRMRWLPA